MIFLIQMSDSYIEFGLQSMVGIKIDSCDLIRSMRMAR
jgi:hypothetical protein